MLKNESCPNCRHEANEKERINEDEESETDSEYESTEYSGEDQDNLDIPEFDEEEHAFWVFRCTMYMLENGDSLEPQGVLPQIPEDNDFLSLWIRQSKLGPQHIDDRGYESA
jgi:hypothetical protein